MTTAAPVGTAIELPVFDAELTTAELDAVALPLQPPVFVVVVAATFVALYGAAVIVYVLLRKVKVIVSPPGGLVSGDAPGVLLSA